MKDYTVSLETAKLAKEKGFDDLVCHRAYGIAGLMHISPSTYKLLEYSKDLDNGCIPAPTQSLLQKWLREKWDICITLNWLHIEVSEKYSNSKIWYYAINHKEPFGQKHSTYEQALEEGLQEALKLIK